MTSSFKPALVSICLSALGASALAGDLPYDFFLVESFNPSYNLAETYVFGINNSNIGLGSDTFGAFIWNETDGKIQLPFSGVNSLNNLGWVNYGHVLYDTATQEYIDIPEPSATYYLRTLLDVNDNMVGVGRSAYGGPSCEPFDCPFGCSNAFVWDEVNGSRHLDVPNLKILTAVNNNNVAVGAIVVGCNDNRGGVVYNLDTDEMINLSDFLPPLPFGPARVWPTDINNAGQVIGTALYGSEPEKPFVWTEEEGFTFLPTIPGGSYGYMHINSINNHGVVVGKALDDVAMVWKSFIWDPTNGMRMLEDLVDEPSNFMLENAYAINDNGWIAGSGHFGPGWATQRGFVLKAMAAPPMPGDLNGDGALTEQDRAMFCAALGSSQGDANYVDAADLDGNGAVDVQDQIAFNALLPPCAGDVVSNVTFAPPADGVTDGADLAYLLGAWGNQASCADFVSNRTFAPPPDGKVDGADLAYLLGAWGPCE